MKKMWLKIKEKYRPEDVKKRLADIGRVEDDPADSRRLILTFHNQSESGVLMAGFRLSEDFIEYLDDFDMVSEDE
jgi:hypothetical protein